MLAAGDEVKNFYMVGPKPEPEIGAPVTQPKFVGQAN